METTTTPQAQRQQDYQIARRVFFSHLLVAIIAIGVFAFIFRGTLSDLRYYAQLKYNGESVTTTMFTFTFEPQKSASDPHYTLEYIFQPKGEEGAIQVTQDITTNDAILFLQGASEIPVSYLPSDPTQSAFIDQYEMPDFRFFAILFVVVVLVPLEMLYHLWRWIRAGRELSKVSY